MSETDTTYVTNANNRTMHKGDRENGPECGSQPQSLATLDAENPLHAVDKFAVVPCTRCFRYTGRLTAYYKDKHTATVVHQNTQDIIRSLPWEIPPNTIN